MPKAPRKRLHVEISPVTDAKLRYITDKLRVPVRAIVDGLCLAATTHEASKAVAGITEHYRRLDAGKLSFMAFDTVDGKTWDSMHDLIEYLEDQR